jgi:hypothetical protein
VEQNPAIETFIDLLKQGKNVVHTAQGYSMFPTLLPEDKVLVSPLAKGELPEVGSVVVLYKGLMEEGRQAPDSFWEGDRRQEEGFKGGKAEDKRQKSQDKSEEKYDRPEVLVIHRLIEINNNRDSGKSVLITRGDSMREFDTPWESDQIAGIAVYFTRKGKNRIIKTRLFSEGRYFINRWLLWGWGRFENLKI